ncbi:MAG: maleylacetoacetate isomerase [Halieaceae bacterium]|nr:maleylacetoacetate isomerase [Halieaceae bacterium]
MKLYSYFRSSAAFRVRIALGLKGLAYEVLPVDLVANEQRADDYLSLNPQALLPTLVKDDGAALTQSMAILEWLEETHPQPALYPSDADERARYRALCLHIACDIHPLNNLRVLRYLSDEFGCDKDTVARWYGHWIRTGFEALEPVAASWSSNFSLGDRPGLFEVCLAPQIYNARRFAVDLDAFPALRLIDARCAELEAFRSAHPHRQIDTPEALREES